MTDSVGDGAGGRHYELPGGGKLSYWIDTDDEEVKRKIVTEITNAVREVRADAE